MLQVLLNKIISASFNSTMHPLTINETTFTIMQRATAGFISTLSFTANTFSASTITTVAKNIYRQTGNICNQSSLLSFKNNNYEILE